MRKLKLAIIGLGGRGYGTTSACTSKLENVEITAVCDLYTDRIERLQNVIKDRHGHTPFGTTDYREVLKRDDVEAVYVAAAWESHVEIAIASLRAGKITACEVGGSYSINECFELVRAYEETGTPFMFMENCCYDREELLATALVRAGKLGKIVHCDGAYQHDLRDEISEGNINRHYRLRNYTVRNCDNYPTHDLGPIAKILNINRGNRFVSLVSLASGAWGLEEYIENHPELVEKDPTLKDRKFMQGDVVTTIIKCAGGETITLTLDTTTPSAYDRRFTVKGTKGRYSMTQHNVYLDGMTHDMDKLKKTNNLDEYEPDYLHPIWLNMTEEDMERGHGGMDGIMFSEFVKAALNGTEMPIDVYDGASWMCISALSEQSIAMGGAPQAIPDFTNGKWILREPKDVLDDLPRGNG